MNNNLSKSCCCFNVFLPLLIRRQGHLDVHPAHSFVVPLVIHCYKPDGTNLAEHCGYCFWGKPQLFHGAVINAEGAIENLRQYI